MGTIILCNILIILCVGMLGFFFAPRDFPRWFCFLWAANLALGLSVFGWLVFIGAHFATKYW